MDQSSEFEFGHSSLGLLDVFCDMYGVRTGYQLPDDTIRALRNVEFIHPHISSPTIRPLVSNEPTLEAILQWKEEFKHISVDSNFWMETGNILISKLTRIPQDVFERELIRTYRSVQTALQDIEDTRFIYYSGGRRRSNEWARAVASEHLPDDHILQLPMVDYYRMQSGEYSTGVILDDAGFSAVQVTDHLKNGHRHFGMRKFFIIMPYLTKFAVEEIERVAGELNVTIEIADHNSIPEVEEVLGSDKYRALQHYAPELRVHRGQALTYFAHKVPDERSLLPYINYPRAVGLVDRLHPLVPKGYAAYHDEYIPELRAKLLLS